MSNLVIDTQGNKSWYNSKGEFHRLDGPALEFANGDKFWYKNNQLHRLDGPACDYADGIKLWLREGSLYSLVDPAIDEMCKAFLLEEIVAKRYTTTYSYSTKKECEPKKECKPKKDQSVLCLSSVVLL